MLGMILAATIIGQQPDPAYIQAMKDFSDAAPHITNVPCATVVTLLRQGEKTGGDRAWSLIISAYAFGLFHGVALGMEEAEAPKPLQERARKGPISFEAITARIEADCLQKPDARLGAVLWAWEAERLYGAK